MVRFRTSLLAAIVLAIGAGEASAQHSDWIKPPSNLPKSHRGTQNLDLLFEALKVAPDE